MQRFLRAAFVATSIPLQAGAADQPAAAHLAELAAQAWGTPWKDAKVTDVRVVEQKADLSNRVELPPVGYARIETAGGATGYLMWEGSALIEFALDQDLEFAGEGMRFVKGVTATQQFPIPRKDELPVASGCVPTSAASLVSWWADHGAPKWRGRTGTADTTAITLRLREHLPVTLIHDRDGFADQAMDLTGASPATMAEVLQKDAAACGVDFAVTMEPLEKAADEFAAGRPVLLSCYVRVPHKPELSWGHALVGVGETTVNGATFFGVADNFYPTRHGHATRWIHRKFFSPRFTAVRPRDQPAASP
ncbi:hypothetical protein [Luteolibacter marinus]|uniref:hypothetical protein n=1 Tax=Luteolibacter marinus TaxID=2776705 RepID=UPI001868534B|nr:hypothetical protein [Luteolibacter marinus]